MAKTIKEIADELGVKIRLAMSNRKPNRKPQTPTNRKPQTMKFAI